MASESVDGDGIPVLLRQRQAVDRAALTAPARLDTFTMPVVDERDA